MLNSGRIFINKHPLSEQMENVEIKTTIYTHTHTQNTGTEFKYFIIR